MNVKEIIIKMINHPMYSGFDVLIVEEPCDELISEDGFICLTNEQYNEITKFIDANESITSACSYFNAMLFMYNNKIYVIYEEISDNCEYHIFCVYEVKIDEW